MSRRRSRGFWSTHGPQPPGQPGHDPEFKLYGRYAYSAFLSYVVGELYSMSCNVVYCHCLDFTFSSVVRISPRSVCRISSMGESLMWKNTGFSRKL